MALNLCSRFGFIVGNNKKPMIDKSEKNTVIKIRFNTKSKKKLSIK